MSNCAKRKHLVHRIFCQNVEPLTENQTIVRVVRPRGNNLHEVETPDGDRYLMSMPTKFRNVAYIKSKDYVLVQAIEEGNKVKAEMVNIIFPKQIPEYVKLGIWPEAFMSAYKDNKSKESSFPNSDSDEDIVRNTNRPTFNDSENSDANTDDEDDSGNSAGEDNSDESASENDSDINEENDYESVKETKSKSVPSNNKII